MTVFEWIIIGSMIAGWIISAIALWVQFNIKLKEMDMKIQATETKIAEHINLNEIEQSKFELALTYHRNKIKMCERRRL